MKTNPFSIRQILPILITLFVGLAIGYALALHPHSMMELNTDQHSESSMEGMMGGMISGIKNLNGDEFDKAFLEEMITHHQGAVDMAYIVLQKSNQPQLKSFAQAIIDAQDNEIVQMKKWLKDGFTLE